MFGGPFGGDGAPTSTLIAFIIIWNSEGIQKHDGSVTALYRPVGIHVPAYGST